MKKRILILVICTIIWAILQIEGAYGQNLQISGGNNFSVSLCSDGKVYAWGKNDAGQIGRDATNTKYTGATYSTPQLVYLPASNTLTMKQADAGSGNTGIVLACDGSVWQWGGNCGNGNIGNGVTGSSCSGSPTDGSDFYSAMQRVVKGAQTPNATSFLNNIIYINASTQSSFAVESTGKVLAWGNNSTGALGNGVASNTGNTYTPSYVLTAASTPLTGIVTVEGSDYGGYALSSAGFVYSWGYNTNNDLGRTPTGADQYYATRVKAWDYSKNDGSLVDLSGIVKMTGGDTHGLAIDVNGNVWSWGGDWGPGQRGGGSCGCNNPPYAVKVIDPSAGALCVQNSWKIGPWLSGAIDISAGQQHSIVLLNNGKVLTFGNNASGQLGNGTTTSTGCPVFVKTNATTDLTGIVSISDGDLWSFALTSSGQVYVWGENGNNELGIPGNNTDQTYAYLNPAIPTACSGSLLPCPIASLGQDILKCPGVAVNLLAGDNGDTYQYTWYSGPSATGPWTQIGAANRPYASGAGATISVTAPMFYRVVIHDTRAYVADKCGPCVDSEDIIQVTDRTPPLTTSMAGTCGSTDVCFQIASTGAIDNNAFDWYAAMTGGSKLNSSGTINPFCTPKAGLTLNGSNYEIWVDDMRKFQSTVGPTTSPCGTPTASAGGSKYQQQFILYDNATITALDIYYKTHSVNASPDNVFINVYSNDPNKNSSSNDGVNTFISASAATTVPRTSTSLQLFSLSGFNLSLTGSPAGTKYWLEVTGLSNGEFGEMTCAYSYPVSDAIIGRDVIVIGGATANAQVIQKTNYSAFAFNWQFTYEDGYPCGRFKVTAPNSTAACLHVDYLYFEGENKGNQNFLKWATASEKNSDYFEVQISYNGIDWTSIGTVKSTGNSSSTQEYHYVDPVRKSGRTYYRIVEHDLDGSLTISTIVYMNPINTKISIKPNPNNGQFTIETNGTLGDNTEIQVLDAIGRVVYQSTDDFSFKSVSKELSLTGLGKGIYFVKVFDGNYSDTQKIIVE